jgi:hypothetical protein
MPENYLIKNDFQKKVYFLVQNYYFCTQIEELFSHEITEEKD